MRDRYASLREGLVGAWIPSVSGSGLLLPDISGYGNNGALTNMGPEDWVSSQYGRALDFDGTDDYVDSPSVSLANFSASFFVNHTGANALGDAVSNKSLGGAGTAAGFVIGANGSSNQWQFTVDSGSGAYLTIYSVSRVSLFANNTWTHCICTRSYGSLSMWVNGIDVTSGLTTASSGTLPSTIVSNNSLIIGSRPSAPARSISGQLDDVRIYNRALSEPEIKLLSQEPGVGFKRTRSVFDFGRKPAYLPPTPTDYRTVRVKQTEHASLREGLVGAWCPSIEGSGNMLPDLSGQGNNGTLTNMGPEDWVSSQYGRALDFDGVDDYSLIGDVLDSSFVGTSARFSIASWIYLTSTGVYHIVSKNADANFSENQRQFGFRCNNQFLQFFWFGALNGSSVKVISSIATIPLNTWTHVFSIFDASIANADQKVSFFINGISASYTIAFTSGSPVSIQDGAAPLTIGAQANIAGTSSFANFLGQLDDIRIYNRALSEPEIKLLASRPGIGLRPQRRTMYYAPPVATGARRRRILTSMP